MIRTIKKILSLIGIKILRKKYKLPAPDIDFVCMSNYGESYIALKSGEFVPITNGFGPDGEDCELEEAVSIVAGPTKRGTWISMELGPARSIAGKYLH